MGFLLNPYIYGGYYFEVTNQPLMLYSLHQVDAADSDLIRVRRSSDSAESDFNATEISDGTLTTWTGANDGFIAKWYNLGSGGATYDLVQTTAASQPRIVSSGTLDTDPDNGNASIFYDGTNDYLNLSNSWDTTADHTAVFCFNRGTAGTNSISLGQSSAVSGYMQYWFTDNSTYWWVSAATGVTVVGNDSSTGDYLDFLHYSGTTEQTHRNNVTKSSITYTYTTAKTLTTLGRRNANYHDDYIQFFALYTTDESSERTTIQDEINNVLSIY